MRLPELRLEERAQPLGETGPLADQPLVERNGEIVQALEQLSAAKCREIGTMEIFRRRREHRERIDPAKIGVQANSLAIG